MCTKKPGINILVEPSLHRALQDLAESAGVSLSTVAHDLIREAINLREDAALAALLDIRIRALGKKETLSHGDIWE